jgi:hypothetical protein
MGDPQELSQPEWDRVTALARPLGFHTQRVAGSSTLPEEQGAIAIGGIFEESNNQIARRVIMFIGMEEDRARGGDVRLRVRKSRLPRGCDIIRRVRIPAWS